MKKAIPSLLLVLSILLCTIAIFPAGAAAATSGSFTYTLDKSGAATITGYSGTDAVLTIPAELDGHPVRTIGQNAINRKSFTKVILSEGIEVLDSYSFEHNDYLTEIQLPHSLKTISTMAFQACTKLKALHIPENVSTIGTHLVWNSGVEQITVDAANQTLQSVDGVLYSKDGKTLHAYPPKKEGAYTVLDGTEVIARAAFMNCKVTALQFPASLRSLEYQAFSCCNQLTSVSFATGPAQIGSYVFQKCSTLTELIIPAGTNKLGGYLVAECTALKKLSLPGSITEISEKAFRDAPSGLTVYTPAPGKVSELADAVGITLILTESEKAQAVMLQIDALGTITSLNQAPQVAAARAAYDALESWQQELVENLEDLKAAEAAIEACKQPAYAVVRQIDALGTITSLNQEPQVAAARAAYEALELPAQELVENYTLLVAAEAAITALKLADGAPLEKGDITGDGSVNVADIMALKNIIMSDLSSPELLEIADFDNSGQIDVADIVALKKIIMGLL